MKKIVFIGLSEANNWGSYFKNTFEIECAESESEVIKKGWITNSYVIYPSYFKTGNVLTVEKIVKSEFTSIFLYLYNKGFNISGKKGEALFISYILKEKYCKSIEDFWVLYEAICEVVSFADTIELWDTNYDMYAGLKMIMLSELDRVAFVEK